MVISKSPYPKLLLSCLLFLITLSALSQPATISGSVFDDKTGETLPGVTVFLEGTTLGTLTDFDGKFTLQVPPGKYTLRISFISYETVYFRDVVLTAGKTIPFDNIRLKESLIQLSEVTVTAKAATNTETSVMYIKQKGAGLIDGLSAAGLRKTGDSDVASSMRRVTGVSLEGGKYVYIRGLGDRYTKTLLNGMDIPGLDPDRNTLQMDIFPSNIIDNIIVSKTFTVNLPADFTGGITDITTRNMPEGKMLQITLSAGFNPSMHFNPDYLYYKGGSTDWLGFDDGTRKIPATTDIPRFSEVVGNPGGTKAQRYRSILQSFSPEMSPDRKSSLMDYNFGITAGNSVKRAKTTWGYHLSLSYKNTTELYRDARYARYGLYADPSVTKLEVRESQAGDYGVKSTILGALAGISLQTATAGYRLTILHLQNGESKAGTFNYINNDQGSYFEGIQYNLEYSQRSLTNLLFQGTHRLKNDKWKIDWRLAPTLSTLYDPDVRFTRYEIRGDKYSISTEAGFPERIWRDLIEVNLAGKLHAERKIRLKGRDGLLAFCASTTYKNRDYIIRNFQINLRSVELTGNPDEIFDPGNLWPYNNDPRKGTTYETPFIPNNPNKYTSTGLNNAVYASVDLPVTRKIKAIIGLRTELYTQHYTGSDQLGTRVLNSEKVLDETGFFPALNVIYAVKENSNLRLALTRTTARPSFKELSYAEIFDPITGRVFIGGLFRDANDQKGIVYWDGNLKSSDIANADLRYEWFGNSGQTFSAGVFYKYFNNPIEIVQFATQAGAFQPRNVGDGFVTGAELEFRKRLDFLSPVLQNILFTTNFTYSVSGIKLSETEYSSRLANARTGEQIEKYRSMAGQSPYLINAGLSYEGSNMGFARKLEAGICYNVQGKTLEVAGIADRPDIYSVPFHSLQFNISKTFGQADQYQAGVKIDNLLQQQRASVYRSYQAAGEYYARTTSGILIQATFKYNIPQNKK